MGHSHADSVGVLRRDREPAHFLWQGHLYRVRRVLAHWQESEPSASCPSVSKAKKALAGVASGALNDGSMVYEPSGDSRWSETVGYDREVWRVEASPGRSGAIDVYDLHLDRSAGDWALTRPREHED